MALRNELRSQGDFLFKYRSYLPVVFIVPALYVYIQHQLYLQSISQVPSGLYEICCVGVSLFGLLIRVVTIGFSADNTSGRNTKVGQVADSVNTTGMYSICRHPLYVGNFFMWLGIAGFTQNVWFLVAFTFMYWIYYERIMFAEEEFLISKYGDEYLNWSKRVPAFIPKLGNWEKSINSFSWIKVIRQEKTGILNLFLTIIMVKIIGELVVNHQLLSDVKYWIAFGAVLVYYVVVKTIQKTTSLLKYDR
jgi:protein-S-isoprenylcysteine O-methyltransferase Ste14